MKKIMIAFASALVLAACGTGNTAATTTTDSTTVATDSTLVDTVVPQVDTTATVTKVTTDKAFPEGVK
jgi:hypothetical protein